MGDIVLSAGVRKNLLSLQNTADLMALTQNRLATGKKVNTALDNPFNYFTAAALNNRAGDMNSLLDGIGQSQKTIEQADLGITAITKLVESAKSLAKQARQTTQPAATYNQAITGANVPADNAASSAAVGSANFATAMAGAGISSKSSLQIDTAALTTTDFQDAETLTIQLGAASVTFEYDPGSTGVGAGNVAFTDAASFEAALNTAFGAANVDSAAGVVTITGNFADNFATSGTGSPVLTNANAVDGGTLTINDGSTTSTFRKVAAGDEMPADGTFSDLATLQSALAASTLADVTLSNENGGLKIANTSGTVTVGGTVGTALGFSAAPYSGTNATLGALAGESFSIKVGAGAAQTFNFTSATTRADLDAWLDGLSLGTGITASLNAAGAVEIASTSSDIITVSGTGNATTTLGLVGTNNGVYTPTPTVTSANDQRADYQAEFNETIAQIDTLARDSSYNGVNLLLSDSLKVIFNEDGSSMLNIEGVDFTSAGLGLLPLTADDFQNNITTDAVLAKVDAALRSLRTQAATFGTKLGTVETRQNFTKSLIQTLETGADNLVLADTNEEGANMLALQTRQSLSTTALSLSAQADQAVLRLFG